jgi:hypothetical protein
MEESIMEKTIEAIQKEIDARYQFLFEGNANESLSQNEKLAIRANIKGLKVALDYIKLYKGA